MASQPNIGGPGAPLEPLESVSILETLGEGTKRQTAKTQSNRRMHSSCSKGATALVMLYVYIWPSIHTYVYLYL